VTSPRQQVVDPIRGSPAFGIAEEVVDVDLLGLVAPHRPGVLEVADQFLLLAVDADDRQAQFREDVDPLLDVDELPVPIRVVWPGEPLHVDPR
jgi:hypothetical protein